MSRAATATPPPQTYFPQRNSTPTMRHCAAPTVSAAHFANRGYQHQPHKRKTKNLPQSSASAPSGSPLKKPATTVENGEALGLSFEDLGGTSVEYEQPPQSRPISRQDSISSYSSSASVDSFQSSRSEIFTGDLQGSGSETGRSTPTIASVSSSISRAPTQLLTPVASEASFPISSSSQAQEHHEVASPQVVQLGSPAVPRGSWVGKMAMAVVNTGMSMGIPFGQHVKKDTSVIPPKSVTPVAPAVVEPIPAGPITVPSSGFSAPKPSIEELSSLSPEQRMARQREWAEAENRKVTECARLCSQWPQSGYNMTKHGPNGANCYYSPQSFANPQHVAGVMQRQAELEHYLAVNSMMFFSCQRDRASHRDSSSDDESDPSSAESYESSHPSPSTSMSLSVDDAMAKQEADIRAAMASPIISIANLPNGTQVPAPLLLSPKSVKGARSLPELDSLARSMVLSKDESESAMDIDQSESGSLVGSTDLSESASFNRPARAQSCGAKRPSTAEGFEEEKRRKVDEAMVVEEAVETGVIAPATSPSVRSSPNNRMSSSVPDLNKAKAAQAPPAVFGVVVKTSDTHPIIISPFFPSDLLPILTKHMVMPAQTGPFSQTPLLLASDIDVPSLLLSYVPPTPNPAIIPSPIINAFGGQQTDRKVVGNLLLSSCPGKRLRLDGPSRGRGPVCRDLATDLRRIKSEGVGCLVCCLDDPELALLGVPWETYREIANEIGLDVIRLPMPDGFTPVNIGLFDSQITLIATKYSLQGVNVLVHCRGGVGRAGLTACAWAIKMGFVQPHPSLLLVESASTKKNGRSKPLPQELEHQIVMSVVERVIAMIRSRRGLKAIESFEQVQFLARYVGWLRREVRGC
ncbi:hypothetical protein I302_107990 [Kwoniella bestiolae CBS 10118]|uniref:Tyrosine specific protein phosphatases domain-containing protein n=1 Tax=Kwoniella bestiolae CBS 10118 TaxID=1296100 RepID=A0A1B9FX09_9TREE|nr:hypothetical protein I302_07645 [Kwoniella bestiolae CBS 10118]OCF23291.1 hypothetical protein I302_07645 [Kwoniella bestiolae CBS 10118]